MELIRTYNLKKLTVTRCLSLYFIRDKNIRLENFDEPKRQYFFRKLRKFDLQVIGEVGPSMPFIAYINWKDKL